MTKEKQTTDSIVFKNMEKQLSKKHKNSKVTYFWLATQCIDDTSTSKPGITTKIMRIRFKLLDELEKNNDDKKKSMELSKEEHGVLLACVLSMSWGISDKVIIDFEDYLLTLNK